MWEYSRLNLARISIILLIALIFAHSASANESSFRPQALGDTQEAVVFFVDERPTDSRALNFSSSLSFFDRPWVRGDPNPNMGSCRSTKDPDCDFNSVYSAIASSILGVCDSQTKLACIESVSIGSNSSTLEPAVFERYLEGRTIDEDLEMAFYGGRTASVWTSQNVRHLGGEKSFLMIPVIDYTIYRGDSKFQSVGFSVDMIPFSSKVSRGMPDEWKTEEEIEAESALRSIPRRFVPKIKEGGDPYSECFEYQKNMCLVQHDFAESTWVQVKVRLPSELGGWFKGRLMDADIQVDSNQAGGNLITVTAAPTKVARVAHVADVSSLTTEERLLYEEWFWGGGSGSKAFAGPAAVTPSDRVFAFMDSARSLFEDKARGVNSYWNFATVNAGAGSQCLVDTSRVLGIVTTNAMGYQGTSPTFDGSSLNYRVVGPHFMPDGVTEVRGTYDLVVRSEVARCLYGFDSAPISATVSIASSTGEAAIATTSVSESDGWLKLNARNFTFSEKKISVTVTQESIQETNPTSPSTVGKNESSEVNKSNKKAKKTLCVKRGAKSIRTAKANCPKGYKAKG